MQIPSELSYRKARRAYGFAFRLALILSALSFISATVYTQWRLAGVKKDASTIETVASPSIEHLLKTSEALNQVNRVSTTLVSQIRHGDLVDSKPLDAALENLVLHSRAYLDLSLLPMEGEDWKAVDLGVEQLTKALKDLTFSIQRGDDRGVITRQFLEVVQPAAFMLRDAIPPTISHDASIAKNLARDIHQLYEDSLKVVIFLDALSLALSILAGFIVYLMFRRHSSLEDLRSRLQSERVDELSIFAGRVAHDIKNPLNTISMGVEVLALSESPTDERETVDMMTLALRRATQLVDGLLSFACAGRKPAVGEHVNASSVLADLGKEYYQIGRDAQIDFSVECPARVEVDCSAGILASILENLIRNAIKYMGRAEKGTIVARVQVLGDKVHFEVEDSGPGIPEEIKDHLFEPFVRGQPTEGNGIGLGLATVKRLVEAYGGAVGVKSERGFGATFWFDLPLASTMRSSKLA